MDFQNFSNQLKELLMLPLPGAKAHGQLLPSAIGKYKQNYIHATKPRLSGVMILLYPHDGRVKFPLIRRTEYDGHHSGQVSFPGGKTEPTETQFETALRELYEEIGVKVAKRRIIGKLSNFFVIPSNFIVSPIVACIPRKPQFKPNQLEVARILEGDLGEIIKVNAIKMRKIAYSKQDSISKPHFLIENEIVWGATAMILNELRIIIQKLSPQLLE